MKQIVDFCIMGFEPVSWQSGNHGSKVGASGKTLRWTSYGKSKVAEGRLTLPDWKRMVADGARQAMAGKPPVRGPVHIHFEFYYKAPEGVRHGSLFGMASVPRVKPKPKARDPETVSARVRPAWDSSRNIFHWKEVDRSGSRATMPPDLTNLVKACEDGCNGILVMDDVQTRSQSSITLYGAFDGVRVIAHEIEPNDFPGDPGEDPHPADQTKEATP